MQGTKAFLIIVFFVALAVFGIYLAKGKSKDSAKESKEQTQIDASNAKDIGAIFFYGSTCPHCKNVEKYFNENKVQEKIKIDMREVYGSKENAQLMTEKQNLCKDLSEDDKGGVPFLYTPEKCVVGDQPIIDFFNDQINKAS